MVHHADVHRAVATIAALAAASQAHAVPNPNASYSYRILNAPTSSDERAIKTLGLQREAQRRSDALFSALSSILGGAAPKLNFVSTGTPGVENDLSANVVAAPGMPASTVNVSPLAVEGLINNASPWHNSSVNQLPHEDAHLRQIPSVLANLALREGSAQAFADLVAPAAAQRARIPYAAGSFDGSYAPFVKQAQDLGAGWLTGGQFGHPPVNWP